MKYVLFILALTCCFSACKKETPTDTQEQVMTNAIPDVNAGDWTAIFNGENFDGWHVYNQEGMHPAWSVEEGAIKFDPAQEAGPGIAVDIVTDNDYEDFVLALEWKVSEAGNSGIFWGVQEMEQYKEPYWTGPEIQVLDNVNHPDAKNGTNRQAGALYDMISPPDGAAKPFGEWNQCVIEINQTANEGRAWLNGTLTAEFALHGEEWEEMVGKSKFADWEHFGKSRKGKISLQDHDDVVWFRNVKIQEL
ncbi:MAG: DUF1080 domain-containing protein [Saprospiraceae bacterium]|nr:DUF1080 domain-containing protein [Saprospiraceae bacterium]